MWQMDSGIQPEFWQGRNENQRLPESIAREIHRKDVTRYRKAKQSKTNKP